MLILLWDISTCLLPHTCTKFSFAPLRIWASKFCTYPIIIYFFSFIHLTGVDWAPDEKINIDKHSQGHSLSCFTGLIKIESYLTSDWLNRMDQPIRSWVTFKLRKVWRKGQWVLRTSEWLVKADTTKTLHIIQAIKQGHSDFQAINSIPKSLKKIIKCKLNET